MAIKIQDLKVGVLLRSNFIGNRGGIGMVLKIANNTVTIKWILKDGDVHTNSFHINYFAFQEGYWEIIFNECKS